jgi:hypothetical protein
MYVCTYTKPRKVLLASFSYHWWFRREHTNLFHLSMCSFTRKIRKTVWSSLTLHTCTLQTLPLSLCLTFFLNVYLSLSHSFSLSLFLSLSFSFSLSFSLFLFLSLYFSLSLFFSLFIFLSLSFSHTFSLSLSLSYTFFLMFTKIDMKRPRKNEWKIDLHGRDNRPHMVGNSSCYIEPQPYNYTIFWQKTLLLSLSAGLAF